MIMQMYFLKHLVSIFANNVSVSVDDGDDLSGLLVTLTDKDRNAVATTLTDS